MKLILDATLCDGFGTCAEHAPDIFELDEWGYASLRNDGVVAVGQETLADRAIRDCPVHAISVMQ